MVEITRELSSELGANPNSEAYADGPFVLTRNGTDGFGQLLMPDAPGTLAVNDELRTWRLDARHEATISEDGSRVSFTLSDGTVAFAIRPITLEDQYWAYPEFTFPSVEHLKLFAAEQMRRLSPGFGEDVEATYGVTMDDDGNVLDLIRSDNTGTFYRDAGVWIGLDLEDETDAEVIDGHEWVDVSGNAIAFFDSMSEADALTRPDIEPFIQN